jgi:hypothetical protein
MRDWYDAPANEPEPPAADPLRYPRSYGDIKRLAKHLQRPITEILALSTRHDPFYAGQPGQRTKAVWPCPSHRAVPPVPGGGPYRAAWAHKPPRLTYRYTSGPDPNSRRCYRRKRPASCPFDTRARSCTDSSACP